MYKTCRICKRVLPIDDYHKNPDGKDGHRNICKHCKIEQVMKKRKGNRDYKVKHRIAMHPIDPHKKKQRNHKATLSVNNKRKIKEIEIKVNQNKEPTCKQDCVNYNNCLSWGIEKIETNLALTCRKFKNREK